jgi:hypothetical protein
MPRTIGRPRVSSYRRPVLFGKKQADTEVVKDMGDMAMPMEGTGDARAAKYRPADSLQLSCAMCSHFMSTGIGGCCELIAGPIRPDYTCDMYEAGSMDMGDVAMQMIEARFEVSKSDDAMQMIFGWASVAVTKDGETVVDSQGDEILPTDLENAAYEFVLNFRETDEMHTEEVRGHLVESFVVTTEKLEAMGLAPDALPIGWWTGFYIPDKETYETARDRYPMFSIAGVGVREEVSA